MSDNIVELKIPWFGKIPADDVLSHAVGKLESVLVIGIEKNGCRRYYASSDQLSLAAALYEAELFKLKLLRGDFGSDE